MICKIHYTPISSLPLYVCTLLYYTSYLCAFLYSQMEDILYTYTILILWSILCLLPPPHLFVMVISNNDTIFVHHPHIRLGRWQWHYIVITYLEWKEVIWSESLIIRNTSYTVPDTLQCSPRKITLQPQAHYSEGSTTIHGVAMRFFFGSFVLIDILRGSLGILDTTDISTREKHWAWIWLQFRLPLWLKICWVGVMSKIEPPAYCTPQIYFNEWIPPKCLALLYFNLSNEKNAGWLGYHIGDYATHLYIYIYIGRLFHKQ